MSFESSSHSAAASSSTSTADNTRKRSRSNSADPSSETKNPRNVVSRTSASWGAKSLAPPSKLSARKSPFSDFGSYMVEKNRKLRDQFEADASSSSLAGSHDSGDGKGIFHGVSIFVDGYTNPSSQELKGYMLKHGGKFENYFSKHRVTHIICSNLPYSKVRNLRAFSRGLPVVKPTWVLDSVAADKLLNWVPYQLDELVKETQKQKKLSSFFALKSMSSFEDAETPVDLHVKIETEVSLSKGEPKHSLLPRVGDFSECKSQGSEELACSGHEKFDEVRNVETSFTNLESEHSGIEPFQTSPHRPSNSLTSSCIDNQHIEELPDIKYLGVSNQKHSTLSDPNFVENYFKNSRLHFIGTWRNRYRKRFPNILSRVKSKNSNVKSISATQKAAFIHIDMDCFFVSVIIRNYPELLEKPVAVCHSDNPKGTAEISSANYPARDYGVRAGMFVRDAKALCPHLVIFPYNFEAYEDVADQFYSILHKYCNKVQALSCDEAFLDVTECDNDDPVQLASKIRQEIVEITQCTASAGVAENLLLARLATRSAKPNGQCFIPSEKVDDYLKDLSIKALPGIGHALEEKLKNRQIQTCGQLLIIPKEALQKDFGKKTGDMLWNYCRGIDYRMVEVVQETKSIGAEVNWGVRFNDMKDCQHFLTALCKEVSLRLQGCGVQGRTVMLKVKRRRKGAEDPIKYMGCGECDNMSRSMTLPVATGNITLLHRICKQLFGSFHIDVKEVRGVGMQISKLESAEIARQVHEENALESWLASASEKSTETCKGTTCLVKERENGDVSWPDGEAKLVNVDCVKKQADGNSRPGFTNMTDSSGPSHSNPCNVGSHDNRTLTLPPLWHLDIGVVKNLPPEIISEMNEMYDGKLCDFMKKHEEKDGFANAHLSTISMPEVNGSLISFGNQKEENGIFMDTAGGQTDAVEPYSGAGNKGKQPVCSPSGKTDSVEPYSGAKNKGKQPLCSPAVSIYDVSTETKTLDREVPRLWETNISKGKSAFEFSNLGDTEVKVSTHHEIQPASISCSRSNNLPINTSVGGDRIDLMPASLSQIDVSILQQLPEELKVNLLELLPAHRASNSSRDTPSSSTRINPCCVGVQNSENPKIHLWLGNPPKWVEKFKLSNCLMLKMIAELYSKSRTDGLLSTILQPLISYLPLSFDSSGEAWDEALSNLCELLVEYIELKIESDIEELYICFRLLKRFTSMSKFLLEAYNIVLPFLQASVNESYGGNLQLSITEE